MTNNYIQSISVFKNNNDILYSKSSITNYIIINDIIQLNILLNIDNFIDFNYIIQINKNIYYDIFLNNIIMLYNDYTLYNNNIIINNYIIYNNNVNLINNSLINDYLFTSNIIYNNQLSNDINIFDIIKNDIISNNNDKLDIKLDNNLDVKLDNSLDDKTEKEIKYDNYDIKYNIILKNNKKYISMNQIMDIIIFDKNYKREYYSIRGDKFLLDKTLNSMYFNENCFKKFLNYKLNNKNLDKIKIKLNNIDYKNYIKILLFLLNNIKIIFN